MAATQVHFFPDCIKDKDRNTCCYDRGIQCDQNTGTISRRVLSDKSHPACPVILESPCEPCNWEKYRCEKNNFMSEQATNYQRCHYGKDYIRFPKQIPCNRRVCENNILKKYDGSGYGVTEVGSNKQPKACVIQCKKSYQYIQYYNDKMKKDVSEKTNVKCNSSDGVA